MNLTEVKSVPVPRKRRTRVGRGRGSGWGKTSRRGQKGAASRAGWGGGIMREGGQMPLARRLPKKGFNNENFRVSYEVVNVDRLSAAASSGEVNPDTLKAAGILKRSARWVKILGDGEPGAALRVSAHHFSSGARAKIEKAGGTVTVLPGRHGRLAPASPGERHKAIEAIRTAILAARAAAPKPAKKEEAAEEEAGKAKKEPRAAKAPKAGPGAGPGAGKGPKAPRPPKAGKSPGGSPGEKK